MIVQEYDPEIHITAGELRERGWKIADSIPDCAWIRYGAWKPTGYQIHGPNVDYTIAGKMSFEFTEPFNWVTFTFSMPEEGELK
jgi:hypothetical protein